MAPNSTNCLIVVPWELHHVGGVNQVVLNLLRELNQREVVRASVLVSGYGHDEMTSEAAPNGRLSTYSLTVRNPVTKNGSLRTVLSFLWHLPGTILRLRRLVRDEKISILNLHYPTLAALAFLVVSRLRRSKLRIVLSFHGADFNQAEAASGVRKWLWSFVLSSSDSIVTCSEALARRVSGKFPKLRSKIHVVHNGVDQDLLRRIADRGQVPTELEGKRFVFNAATLEPKKGQDTLLRAFAELAPGHPDLVLAIMGRKAQALRSLQALASQLGVGDRVFIWTDVRHEDVIATMRKASVFALPSRIEPFGIVSLEAATFEVPVVASNVGGTPEIIEAGHSGLLVEPGDVGQLRDAIAQLLRDRSAALRMASRLREVVARRFTWQQTAAAYEALFRNGGGMRSPDPGNALPGTSRAN